MVVSTFPNFSIRLVFPLDSKIINKLSSKSGVYNFAEDIDINEGVAFRFAAKGKYIYNLNNHEIKCGSTSLGSIFLNGSVDLTINGEGKNPTLKDILAVAQNIGIKEKQAKEIALDIKDKCLSLLD